MDLDPMESLPEDDEDDRKKADKAKSRLNTLIAITVALLATFMGICHVKDDNICQTMQQAQAKSIDTWAWYQAKKTRLQFAESTVDELEVQILTLPPNARTVAEAKIAKYKKQVEKETAELPDVKKQAEDYDKDYYRWNIHDDQFDLADALLALTISMMAMTSLTQKRWLYGVALVPTFFGVMYGIAGLLGLQLHSDFFAKLLGT